MPCSFGLSATSQQYFSLRTNQPSPTSQPAVHSEQTSTGHQPNEQAVYVWLVLHVYKTSFFYLAVCIHNNMCINLYELQHGNSMRLPFQQTKN
jgi:hypothetical protein